MKKIVLLISIALTSLNSWSVQDPDISKLNNAIANLNLAMDVEYRVLSKTTGSERLVHMYGMQTYQGTDIFGTEFNLAFQGDRLKVFNHKFINPGKLSIAGSFEKDKAVNALASVLPAEYEINQVNFNTINSNLFEYSDPLLSTEKLTIEAIWYKKSDRLVSAWIISHYYLNGQHWYNYLIESESLEVLEKFDMVIHCNFQTHPAEPHHHSASPEIFEAFESHGSPVYRVFAWPAESPNHAERSNVTDPSDANASPYGWHDVNGSDGAEYTTTQGNNVFAKDDKSGNNGGGAYAQGGNDLHFVDSFNVAQNPANFTDAAITNLFYWNNIMHDVWYNYGFDEQSGNFQQNNYGNGGTAGDFVYADAQDGSGVGNANFSLTSDGVNPRMQMYLWNSSSGDDYFQVTSPSFVAGKYLANKANFGPALTKTPITGELVLVQSSGSISERACDAITNGSEISGNIALIEDGNCNYEEKVRNAQNAGAIAVVIYDTSGNTLSTMNPGGSAADITIPSVILRKTDGQFLKAQLGTITIEVALYDSSNSSQKIYDSDFDNGVISHEYTHGISSRLTGGRQNRLCLTNREQMGEGWSDFFALIMTQQPGDEGADARGIGTYLLGQSTDGKGIRQYPYSTNKTVSPYDYSILPWVSVPHGVGSVWCAMLWDMYWAFIDEYGYDEDIYYGTGGNNMAMQLVIDAMKLQPCSPGFVDGRNAILLADSILYDGIHHKMIWEVFAARGLGYSADQGSSNSKLDGAPAYDIPPNLAAGLALEKTAPTEAENGEGLVYNLKATNFTNNTLYDIELRDTLPPGIDVNPADMSCLAQMLDNVLIFRIDSLERFESFTCTVPATVAVSSTSITLFQEDFEEDLSAWTLIRDNGSTQWVRSDSRSNSGDFSAFISDPTTQSDQSISREFEITGFKPILSFYHLYNTENSWDGGVVELFVDNQWIDAAPYFLQNGYNAQIQNNDASAISQRMAYTGNSGEFILTRLDLSDFSGQTISIRFRFVSDAAAGGEGWYIDDVQLDDGVVIQNFLHASFDGRENRTSCLTLVAGEGIPGAGLTRSTIDLISVYPNPADNELIIKGTTGVVLNLQVLDQNGRIVLQESFSTYLSINTESLADGVYTVKLVSDDAVLCKKVVIQH